MYRGQNRRTNWQLQIINTPPSPAPDRSIGRVLDRPRKDHRLILRGPMRGKKIGLFARVSLGSLTAIEKSPLSRPDRTNRYRKAMREAFNHRETKLAERLKELRREFNAI